MGRAWTKETPTRLGVGVESNVQFAERVAAETEGTYIHKRSGSKDNFPENEGEAV
jgi:hypothetical protein